MIDKDKLNFDVADFHGLSTVNPEEFVKKEEIKPSDNPYEAPLSIEEPAKSIDHVKLGFWVWALSVIQALWYCFVGYMFIHLVSEVGSARAQKTLYVAAGISLIFGLGHVLLLARQELGRKVVLLQSYLFLIVIPVGTLLGIIYIRTLHGKKFRKENIY